MRNFRRPPASGEPPARITRKERTKGRQGQQPGPSQPLAYSRKRAGPPIPQLHRPHPHIWRMECQWPTPARASSLEMEKLKTPSPTATVTTIDVHCARNRQVPYLLLINPFSSSQQPLLGKLYYPQLTNGIVRLGQAESVAQSHPEASNPGTFPPDKALMPPPSTCASLSRLPNAQVRRGPPSRPSQYEFFVQAINISDNSNKS